LSLGVVQVDLHHTWQEKITGNKAEFNSEQELLQALESLNEFRPPKQ